MSLLRSVVDIQLLDPCLWLRCRSSSSDHVEGCELALASVQCGSLLLVCADADKPLTAQGPGSPAAGLSAAEVTSLLVQFGAEWMTGNGTLHK
jgi:hypothetical protein